MHTIGSKAVAPHLAPPRAVHLDAVQAEELGQQHVRVGLHVPRVLRQHVEKGAHLVLAHRLDEEAVVVAHVEERACSDHDAHLGNVARVDAHVRVLRRQSGVCSTLARHCNLACMHPVRAEAQAKRGSAHPTCQATAARAAPGRRRWRACTPQGQLRRGRAGGEKVGGSSPST